MNQSREAVHLYVTHLLRDIAGHDVAALKSGPQAALLLEEQFVRDGWPAGQFVASAEQLQSEFKLGRDTCREALGILQARGFIQVRRGRGGGVIIARPALADLVSSFSLHLILAGITVEETLQARRALCACVVQTVLEHAPSLTALTSAPLATLSEDAAHDWPITLAQQLARCTGNEVLALLVTLLDGVLHAGTRCNATPMVSCTSDASVLISALQRNDRQGAIRELMSHPPHSRDEWVMATPVSRHDSPGDRRHAGQVAAYLLREMSGDERRQGVRLTSEAALAERFGFGVPVVRQAIRILEDMGAVYTQRGNGGGLMRCKPQQSALIRQLFAYLLGLRASPQQGFECAERLSREEISLAAQRGTQLTPALRSQWMQTLLPDATLDARRFIALENRIHEFSGNAVIAICLRSLASYNTWCTGRIPQVMDEYLTATHDVLDCIAASDAAGAWQAQSWKNQLLREQMQN